jgi:hypothetical protein
MLVHCTQCGKLIPAEDLNIDTAIGRCRACNAVFSFAKALEQESGGLPARQFKAEDRGKVPLPSGIRVDDQGDQVRYVRRWFSSQCVFLLFFCVLWDGFLVYWYAQAFSRHGVPLMAVLFPLLHVAVGVGLTYFTVCGFVNSTIVEVGSGVISVRHRPLPWWGNRTFESADVDQLYCRRRIVHGKNTTREVYDLRAITKDGREVKLLSTLEEPEQALYLEQEIERRLRIKDRPVKGEYRG